ncbi:MAG: peptide-methionine (S)-S-oxide reductase MsrA [Sediminimonas qiaohouensis]|uniref:Peptide methionine sulfoxide reductase MsrA n=1 Tax=Sediminimonas qiaohouensis TaxID=552061 RepID=A0A7C9HAY3_9RHOB|nr:peptide-methionine (S)-S-oxide reductase MsrA [Sediminimonas qiaohouensis]MTJ04706.1 peptide-methionine (S)-S-oxide reductase MsrA [Sediminimonas qiaohouensis]
MREWIKLAKPAVLTVAIILGLLVEVHPAHAEPKETLTVAGGCFWCVEADFEKVPGVSEVVSGYTGGNVDNPTYKQVTRGGTGHYEAVEIMFDPAKVSREKLLHMFLRSIDPTDAGGQFCDRGASYRTAIFVGNEKERNLAERMVAEAEEDLGREIVTPVLPKKKFYKAEKYHQDYYKSEEVVLFTRFGPTTRAKSYKKYRKGCGRDARVRQLWGNAAPFAGS